jgi:hypothetical protein
MRQALKPPVSLRSSMLTFVLSGLLLLLPQLVPALWSQTLSVALMARPMAMPALRGVLVSKWRLLAPAAKVDPSKARAESWVMRDCRQLLPPSSIQRGSS